MYINRIDEVVEGSGMGLFLIGGHLLKILPQNSKGASEMFVQCMYTVYGCTLFPPVAEICAWLAGNCYQYMTKVSCWANSLV
jgi:hypothetical protein